MDVIYFLWLYVFDLPHSILRNLSVGCASSCGDTSTQTIASTSLSLLHTSSDFHFIHFASLTSSSSIYSFSVIQFNSSSSRSRCSLLTLTSSTSWSYTSTISLTLIILLFTHSTYFGLRYFLGLLPWHCCPLLSRVDKTCSYSNFIRTHFILSLRCTHLLLSCWYPSLAASISSSLSSTLDHFV